jgi:Pvc16 N-terminal domain
MSADAIQLTTEALKGLLETTLGPGEIFVGPPSEPAAGAASASLFLYHLVPNAELRNEPHLDGLRGGGPASPGEQNSIPFDLRYLITVFRPTSPIGGGSPVELLRLGQIIQTLHATPVLTGARLPGQTARLTPDPVSMEEISRVWGLFPETAYQTSVVYLATPVFVDAPAVPVGPRVREVHRQVGDWQEAAAG